MDPRYVEALMVTIRAKLEIAEKLENERLRVSATEEYETVKAYQGRGSQTEILDQAQEQMRLAQTYADMGREDLWRKAKAKHDDLMASWRAYQIQVRF